MLFELWKPALLHYTPLQMSFCCINRSESCHLDSCSCLSEDSVRRDLYVSAQVSCCFQLVISVALPVANTYDLFPSLLYFWSLASLSAFMQCEGHKADHIGLCLTLLLK